MLVGFRGSAKDAESAGSAGADLVIVEARDLEGKASAANNTVLGAWAKSIAPDKAKELRGNGADFLAFEPDSTPAASLLDEELGYVLVLPKDPEELFLRSLDALTLDAIYIERISVPLTVMEQIDLARVGQLSRKPLIAQVQADISGEDLQCLRAAGVVAVLTEGTADGVTKLKTSVAALPARKTRREDRTVVSLPHGSVPSQDHDDDDDDD
jgi:hypothetical protein